MTNINGFRLFYCHFLDFYCIFFLHILTFSCITVTIFILFFIIVFISKGVILHVQCGNYKGN